MSLVSALIFLHSIVNKIFSPLQTVGKDSKVETEAEVSGAQLPSPSTITSTAQSSTAENQSSLDPDTEEALRRKGRLLLQHLQNLDARLNMNNPAGSSVPPFTGLALPRNLLPMQGTRNTSVFTPQGQGLNVPQTVSTSGILPDNKS